MDKKLRSHCDIYNICMKHQQFDDACSRSRVIRRGGCDRKEWMVLINSRERQQQEIVIKSSKAFPGSARDEIWPQDGIY